MSVAWSPPAISVGGHGIVHGASEKTLPVSSKDLRLASTAAQPARRGLGRVRWLGRRG